MGRVAARMTISAATELGQATRVCPRCESALFVNYDRRFCLFCGSEDYTYAPPTVETDATALFTTTRHVLRYIGLFPDMAGRTLQIEAFRADDRNSRVELRIVGCPLECGKPMTQPRIHETSPYHELKVYFRCEARHLIAVQKRSKGGEIVGWM